MPEFLQFAFSGLTVAALRHYHDVALLVPAEVDDATGYRRYRADQLPQAWAIARLRALELSLDEIRAVLAGETEVLGRHLERVERRIWRLQRVHYRLQRLIEREDDLMSEPVTYDVDHRRLGVELFNDTWRLIESREVVRITLMRGTVHVVSARDALLLRPLTEPAHQAMVARGYRDDLAGVDLAALSARVREVVEERPRTPTELVAELAAVWPGRRPQALTNAASAWPARPARWAAGSPTRTTPARTGRTTTGRACSS